MITRFISHYFISTGYWLFKSCLLSRCANLLYSDVFFFFFFFLMFCLFSCIRRLLMNCWFFFLCISEWWIVMWYDNVSGITDFILKKKQNYYVHFQCFLVLKIWHHMLYKTQKSDTFIRMQSISISVDAKNSAFQYMMVRESVSILKSMNINIYLFFSVKDILTNHRIIDNFFLKMKYNETLFLRTLIFAVKLFGDSLDVVACAMNTN